MTALNQTKPSYMPVGRNTDSLITNQLRSSPQLSKKRLLKLTNSDTMSTGGEHSISIEPPSSITNNTNNPYPNRFNINNVKLEPISFKQSKVAKKGPQAPGGSITSQSSNSTRLNPGEPTPNRAHSILKNPLSSSRSSFSTYNNEKFNYFITDEERLMKEANRIINNKNNLDTARHRIAMPVRYPVLNKHGKSGSKLRAKLSFNIDEMNTNTMSTVTNMDNTDAWTDSVMEDIRPENSVTQMNNLIEEADEEAAKENASEDQEGDGTGTECDLTIQRAKSELDGDSHKIPNREANSSALSDHRKENGNTEETHERSGQFINGVCKYHNNLCISLTMI
jgi:hypothetical protein